MKQATINHKNSNIQSNKFYWYINITWTQSVECGSSILLLEWLGWNVLEEFDESTMNKNGEGATIYPNPRMKRGLSYVFRC